MTRGPIPPHERAWRHPSELAAPAHEPTSRVGHLLIASTAAVSLLLVAFLALSMTPKRFGGAERTVIGTSDAVVTAELPAAGSPADTALVRAEGVLRVVSTFVSAGADTGPVAADPVGSGATTPNTPTTEVSSSTESPSTTSVTLPGGSPIGPTTSRPAASLPGAESAIEPPTEALPDGSATTATSASNDTTEPLTFAGVGDAPASADDAASSSSSTSSSTSTTSTTSSSTSTTVAGPTSTTLQPDARVKQMND